MNIKNITLNEKKSVTKERSAYHVIPLTWPSKVEKITFNDGNHNSDCLQGEGRAAELMGNFCSLIEVMITQMYICQNSSSFTLCKSFFNQVLLALKRWGKSTLPLREWTVRFCLWRPNTQTMRLDRRSVQPHKQRHGAQQTQFPAWFWRHCLDPPGNSLSVLPRGVDGSD